MKIIYFLIDGSCRMNSAAKCLLNENCDISIYQRIILSVEDIEIHHRSRVSRVNLLPSLHGSYDCPSSPKLRTIITFELSVWIVLRLDWKFYIITRNRSWLSKKDGFEHCILQSLCFATTFSYSVSTLLWLRMAICKFQKVQSFYHEQYIYPNFNNIKEFVINGHSMLWKSINAVILSF